MSIELDRKTTTSPLESGGVNLTASPIGTTPAGYVQTFANLPSDGTGQDHPSDPGIRSTDMQGHDFDVAPWPEPTPAVVVHAGTPDVASSFHQLTAIVPEDANHGTASGPAVQHLSPEIHKAVPLIADPHNDRTGDAHADHRAQSHFDHSGQGIAHQFDLLIAGGNAAEWTLAVPAAASPHMTSSDGGHPDSGGLNGSGETQVMTGASIGVVPFTFGNDNSSVDRTTPDVGQFHQQSFAALFDLALDLGTRESLVNWKASWDRMAASEPTGTGADGVNVDSTSPPSAGPDGHREGIVDPKGAQENTSTPVDHHSGGQSSTVPIISSGAAFWTVGVDHLDGSSHSSVPFYTAGTDQSFSALAASHLDELHTLGRILGGH